ncbi:MAG: hypothetical protein ACTSRL_03770 [Candidatus Helarchaeota archaeon]
MKECERCLNVERFDTLLQKPIIVTQNGLCNQCIEWEKTEQIVQNYRKAAISKLPKIFEKVKKESHDYDALVSLSGGKDSSTALILAREKYKLKVLAFTTDKGNFYPGVKESINGLTDRLGVDHVYIKVPKPLMHKLFRFGLKTLSTGGIQCKICGGLVHVPILSKFMLKYDIPIIITGLDMWEIQAGYNFERSHNAKMLNPFLYTFPTLRKRWNNYQATVNDCIALLKRFSKETEFLRLKSQFLKITEQLIHRYGLSPFEDLQFRALNFYDISLTAIEISKRETQLGILKMYGWSPPKNLFTGELVGTDCQIGGLINAITSFKHKRKMWSYRIRSGLITKTEALNEIKKKSPKIEVIRDTLKTLGLERLKNINKGGWQNFKYKDLYNVELIRRI